MHFVRDGSGFPPNSTTEFSCNLSFDGLPCTFFPHAHASHSSFRAPSVHALPNEAAGLAPSPQVPESNRSHWQTLRCCRCRPHPHTLGVGTGLDSWPERLNLPRHRERIESQSGLNTPCVISHQRAELVTSFCDKLPVGASLGACARASHRSLASRASPGSRGSRG